MRRNKILRLTLVTISVVLFSACADLVIREMKLSTPSPTTETEITVEAIVGNSGVRQSPPSTVALKVGGETVPKLYEVPALDRGQFFPVSRRLTLDVAQNYQVTAIADVNDDVREIREGNNQRFLFFSVAPAPAEIESLVLSPVDDRTARADGYTGNFTQLDLSDAAALYAYASFNSDSEDALRAILEFELPETLLGKEILSAEFYFHRTIASGSPDSSGFKLYGYSGNGIVELPDAYQTSNQLGPVLRMWDAEHRVDVTEFIRSFDLSSVRYPGFVVRGHDGQGGFHSSEGFEENYRPTLSLRFR